MYCSIDDIKEDYKNLTVDASTALKPATLSKWIDEEAAFIDGNIASRYVLPIEQNTSPRSFLILRRIHIFRVSERVRNFLEVKSNATQFDTEVKQQNYVRTPNDDLKAIRKGDLILVDAQEKSESGGMGTANDDLVTEPFFSVEKQQW